VQPPQVNPQLSLKSSAEVVILLPESALNRPLIIKYDQLAAHGVRQYLVFGGQLVYGCRKKPQHSVRHFSQLFVKINKMTRSND
jgi:hypothetical protein